MSVDSPECRLDRYSRQIRYPALGEAGQRRLLASRVTICGCGALGTVLANHLARAGVGRIRIVDRDFIETHNLQRQILFDEHDVADNLPKAEAAARKLRAINSIDRDRAGRHRHRPHQHPRPGGRRRPDPRWDRQLRDPLPDQRRGGQARQALDLRRGARQRGADDDDHPRQDPVHSLPDRDQPAARDDPHLRDGRRARPGRRRDRFVRGRRGDQDLERRRRRPEPRADHGRRLGLVVPPAQGRRPARQGRLPVLPAAAVRVARRGPSARTRPRSAAATPCRSPPAAASR